MRHTIYCLNRVPGYHMVVVSITIMLFITSLLLMHLKLGSLFWLGASLMAQQVKNLPAMQETQEMQMWSLSWEDLLQEETKTHSNILAGKISWTEEAGGLQSMGSQRVGDNWTHGTHLLTTVSQFPFFPCKRELQRWSEKARLTLCNSVLKLLDEK